MAVIAFGARGQTVRPVGSFGPWRLVPRRWQRQPGCHGRRVSTATGGKGAGFTHTVEAGHRYPAATQSRH